MLKVLAKLEATVQQRRTASPAESYSARLLGDVELLQRKIVEEAHEMTLELGRPSVDAVRLAEESADLLYHLVVALVAAGVEFDEVLRVLEDRS